jgi:hypothetical protein
MHHLYVSHETGRGYTRYKVIPNERKRSYSNCFWMSVPDLYDILYLNCLHTLISLLCVCDPWQQIHFSTLSIIGGISFPNNQRHGMAWHGTAKSWKPFYKTSNIWQKKNSVALSLQANYINWSTATFLSSSSSFIVTRLSGPCSRPTATQKIW